jgi:hypothetical protein
LEKNTAIIDACLRLHNWIVEYRESNLPVDMDIEAEKAIFEEEIKNFETLNPDINTVVHGGEEEHRRGGRPTNVEEECKLSGIALRNTICETIRIRGGRRPATNRYK